MAFIHQNLHSQTPREIQYRDSDKTQGFVEILGQKLFCLIFALPTHLPVRLPAEPFVILNKHISTDIASSNCEMRASAVIILVTVTL